MNLLLKTQNDEPDLLNPNELSTNGKLLDKLLKEIEWEYSCYARTRRG